MDDFDRTFYLQAYPDIAASGVDPLQHYLKPSQRRAGSSAPTELSPTRIRSCWLPTIRPFLWSATKHPRTGAPILAWNICRELKNRCNVIALLLGGGGIASYFAETCDVVVGPFDRHCDCNPTAVGPIVNDICDRYSIDVALVNSIESRAVIRPLSERFVPSVLLVHEFFAYTQQREDFVAALRLAADVVFSARIVQRNALTPRTRQAVEASHVLAQGKCVIPAGAPAGPRGGRRTSGHRAVGAAWRCRKRFFVLGAGTVQYGRGIDLLCGHCGRGPAPRHRRNRGDAMDRPRLRSEQDMGYSAYVQEQMG